VVSVPDDGRVRSVLVRSGQIVRAGQRLLSLDAQPGRLDLDRARSRAAAAVAGVHRVQADADRLRAERHLARLSLQRSEALVAAGIAAAEALDRSRHEVRQAELAYTAGIEAVEAARAQVRLGDVDVLDAEWGRARRLIDAPTAGVIAEVFVQPGQPVYAGTTHVPPSRLLTLAVAGVTEIEVTLDRRSAERLRRGGRASVTVPILQQEGLAARIVAVDEARGQEAVVRARLDAPLRGLRQGMSATVQFTAASRPDRLAVPNHAVAGGGTAGAGVWAVRDGVIVGVPIVLGLRGDFYTEVVAGLTPGTFVVTGPAAIVRTLGVGDRAVAIPAAIQAP
jgi:RND family efflux transporter MFP subunit